MELLYRVHKGLKPNLIDKISGIVESKDASTVNLCLTSPSSKKMVSKKELVRIFGLIIQKLSAGKLVKFLFPYDIKEVKKNLLRFNAKTKEEGSWLWLEIPSPQLSNLVQVLEAASFTTFYAQVDGVKVVPKEPSNLLNSLKQNYFLVVFTLYDESMEILSMHIPSDTIINVSREVGLEEKVKVTANDSADTD